MTNNRVLGVSTRVITRYCWLLLPVIILLASTPVLVHAQQIVDPLCSFTTCDPAANLSAIEVSTSGAYNSKNPFGNYGILTIDGGATLTNNSGAELDNYGILNNSGTLNNDGRRANNPIGRGRYTPGKAFCRKSERGLIPHYRRLPWIPTEQQWKALVEAARQERPRNRVMLALSYDAALRREELCGLETSDIDPAHWLLASWRASRPQMSRLFVMPRSGLPSCEPKKTSLLPLPSAGPTS